MQDHLTSVRRVIVQKQVKSNAANAIGANVKSSSERPSESQVAVALPSHRRAGTVASVRARKL